MSPLPPVVKFLASVRTASEARCAAVHGADIIDCKEPRAGALGALDRRTISAIRAVVPIAIPVSATVGDDAQQASDLHERVAQAANAGADVVKIGFDHQRPWQTALNAMSSADFGTSKLVAVLLADHGIDFDLVRACAHSGFSGVMLDTMDKSSGALPDIIGQSDLTNFIGMVRSFGLFVGLAGALRAHHIADLAALKPDILGFRGALCHKNGRQNALNPNAIARLRTLIDATQTTKKISVTSFEAPTV